MVLYIFSLRLKAHWSILPAMKDYVLAKNDKLHISSKMKFPKKFRLSPCTVYSILCYLSLPAEWITLKLQAYCYNKDSF